MKKGVYEFEKGARWDAWEDIDEGMGGNEVIML